MKKSLIILIILLSSLACGKKMPNQETITAGIEKYIEKQSDGKIHLEELVKTNGIVQNNKGYEYYVVKFKGKIKADDVFFIWKNSLRPAKISLQDINVDTYKNKSDKLYMLLNPQKKFAVDGTVVFLKSAKGWVIRKCWASLKD